MHGLTLFILVITLVGTSKGETICPDEHAVLSTAQHMAWLCELIRLRKNLAKLKEQIERECIISDAGGRWQQLFRCLDFSNITCVDDSSLDNETDLFNCSIIFCKDGQYLDQDALLGVWRQHFYSQKRIMAVRQLINCKRSDCQDSVSPASGDTTTTDQTAMPRVEVSSSPATISSLPITQKKTTAPGTNEDPSPPTEVDEIYEGKVCEYSHVKKGLLVNCSNGQIITILNATYGRNDILNNVPNTADYEKCPGGGENQICNAASTLEKVRQECNGKDRCSLRADNSIFGDPCYGILKYLWVQWKCG